MQLSPNFQRKEFERSAPIPDSCLESFIALCGQILEPIRAQFGTMLITSGYRSPESNQAAHGVSSSQHIATIDWCAADFYVYQFSDQRQVFDWVRNNPKLSWGQVILEHDPAWQDIVHVSWERKNSRREALEGEVRNLEPYKHWDVVPTNF